MEKLQKNKSVKAKAMKAELVEVIKTETVEGTGTEGDPVRIVIRYWEKKGSLIAECEQNSTVGKL